MRRKLFYSARFRDALRDDLLFLVLRREVQWIDLLEADLSELEQLVSAFPRAGSLKARRGSKELRMMPLGRTPFVVWYVAEPDDATAPIVLLRLFGVKQKQPARPRF